MSRLFFLLSGEGSSDIGTTETPEIVGDSFHEGPLTYLIRQMLPTIGRTNTEYTFRFVPRTVLDRVGKTERESKKIRRRSKEDEKGSTYDFFNAACLGIVSLQFQTEAVPVIAIFFKDLDGTRGKPKNWQFVFNLVLEGFQKAGFHRGVPMIPKPVSEAWFLCAIYRKRVPSLNCDNMENTTFGDGNNHQLKGVLEKELKDIPSMELLNEKIQSDEIDFRYINLPSYNAFKHRLEEVV